MALSKSVEDSLNEAESALRNALSFAARQERPLVCQMISEMMTGIDKLKTLDGVFDKLENRKQGDSGFFGISFGDDE
jgi:hypothetical protein